MFGLEIVFVICRVFDFRPTDIGYTKTEMNIRHISQRLCSSVGELTVTNVKLCKRKIGLSTCLWTSEGTFLWIKGRIKKLYLFLSSSYLLRASSNFSQRVLVSWGFTCFGPTKYAWTKNSGVLSLNNNNLNWI